MCLGHWRELRGKTTVFNYAITERGLHENEPTVRRTLDNGNRLTFNFYSEYHTNDPLGGSDKQRLLDEALRVGGTYRHAVVAHPCPDHGTYGVRTLRLRRLQERELGSSGPRCTPRQRQPDAAVVQRLRRRPRDHSILLHVRAQRRLPRQSSSPDLAPGSVRHFLDSTQGLQTWVELAENYWRQFVWSPYHA